MSMIGRHDKDRDYNNNMIILRSILLIFLFLATSFSFADEIVAVVNQNVILRSELNIAYKRALNFARANRSPIEPTDRQVLQDLVSQRIQLDLADKLGIYVTDPQIQARATQILSSQGITRNEQIRRLQREGLTYPEWLEQVRDSMRIRNLQLEQLRSYIKINESEIDNFLITNTPQQLRQATVDLAHIAVSVEDISSGDVENIQALLERAGSIDEIEELLSAGGYAELELDQFDKKTLTSFPRSFYNRLVIMNKGEAKFFVADDYFNFVKLLDINYPRADILREYKISVISINESVVYNGEQVRVRINDIYTQLQSGRSFLDLAVLHSYASSPFQNYIGNWIALDILPDELGKEIINLGPQAFSKPFAYSGGWHIVYLQGVRQSDRTMQKWRNVAYNRLANRKLAVSLPFWINDITSRAYVDYKI